MPPHVSACTDTYIHTYIYLCVSMCVYVRLHSVRSQVLSQDLNLAHTVLTPQVGSGKQSLQCGNPYCTFLEELLGTFHQPFRGIYFRGPSTRLGTHTHAQSRCSGGKPNPSGSYVYGGFPKIGGPFLGVPLNKLIAFLGFIGVPLFCEETTIRLSYPPHKTERPFTVHIRTASQSL